MEDWVHKALARWPDVPALFGWLSLDRRGRWRIRGEVITRPQIVDTINPNYAADEHGRWYFQNGPQRGYVSLDYAPLILRADATGSGVVAHTGQVLHELRAAFLDEEGSLVLDSECGPGLLVADDLEWALRRMTSPAGEVDEIALAAALDLPSGSPTALSLSIDGRRLPLQRLDAAEVPAHFGFVREPQPREGERWSR